MIINYQRNPRYSLFYVGAKILEFLKQTGYKFIDDIYQELRKLYNDKISIEYFYLSLDWLFLIDKVKIENEVVYLK